MSEQVKQSNLKVVSRKVADLVPYERNARWHPENQINQIVESIKKFGWTNPILIDSKQGIISGHGRLEAAKKLGLVEVPTIEISGLSDAEKRALILSENQIAANAGWDTELLSLEIEALKMDDFNLDLLGFSKADFRHLLEPASSDSTPEASAETTEAASPTKPETKAKADFAEYDESLKTDHKCPKCGFVWSGGKPM